MRLKQIITGVFFITMYYTEIGWPFFVIIYAVQKVFFSRLEGKKTVQRLALKEMCYSKNGIIPRIVGEELLLKSEF